MERRNVVTTTKGGHTGNGNADIVVLLQDGYDDGGINKYAAKSSSASSAWSSKFMFCFLVMIAVSGIVLVSHDGFFFSMMEASTTAKQFEREELLQTILDEDEDDDYKADVSGEGKEEEEGKNVIAHESSSDDEDDANKGGAKKGTDNNTKDENSNNNNNEDNKKDDKKKKKESSRTWVDILPTDSVLQRVGNKAPYVLESHKLLFFTVQKTGCTVWKQLFRRMLGHEDWRTGRTFPPKEAGLIQLYHFNHSYATEIMNSKEWTRAIWVRDPRERLLSAYRDKVLRKNIVHKRCCAKQGLPMSKQECLRIPHTFEGFVDMTQFCFDSHWAPMSDRMEEKYLPLLDFVGHTETAYDDAKALMKKIGAWREYGKHGWGLYGNESMFESTSYVLHKTSANNSSEQASRTSKEYTPTIEKKLADRLEKDYSISVYNFTSWTK